jgi:hypothetical protein
MVRNDDRPVGQAQPGAPAGPPATALVPSTVKPIDPPAKPNSAAVDAVPGALAARGSAASAVFFDDPKSAEKPPTAADEIVKGSNGPHDAFGPKGHETRDQYSLGMKGGFYRLGFNRERISGSTNMGLLANTHGGGFDAGFMTRTPFGPHFSIAWGAQVQGTVQKLGETTLIQLNPDILAQARYQNENHQFSFNAGLYNKIGVGWNQGAADRNVKSGEGLADKIKKEFETLKSKAAAKLNQVVEAGKVFLSSVQSALPAARDKFAQLASQRVSDQMGDAAGKILPILGEEVNAAFSGYMSNISAVVGNMQTAMQNAANAQTPSQMQAAMGAFATALGQLQAATAPGSLDPYITQMQTNIANRMGPEGAAQMAKLGAILNQTASEVGSSLMQSLQQAANTAIATGNQILTDMLGDAAKALGNSADAASEANNKREQMTTVAMSSRVGVGLDYRYRIPFLSSHRDDYSTVAEIGGSFYHPVFQAAWADKGEPNPLVVGAATGPQADIHAGVRFTKWFGNVGVGANLGYRGNWVQGGGMTHSPEAGISLSSSF